MIDPTKEAHVCKFTASEWHDKEEQWRLDDLIARDADREDGEDESEG